MQDEIKIKIDTTPQNQAGVLLFNYTSKYKIETSEHNKQITYHGADGKCTIEEIEADFALIIAHLKQQAKQP